MEEGTIERAQSESLTILEFEGLGYVYDWVNNESYWHNKENLEDLMDKL